MPLADVKQGMILRLATGDKVPLMVKSPKVKCVMDEAMLTGEPIPQQKALVILFMQVLPYKMAQCCLKLQQ